MNKITNDLLSKISSFTGTFKGAFNIRENGGCAGRQSTDNIKIESREGSSGLVIRVKPNTKGERVYIPACVTKGGVDDLAYNDFYIGENADIIIEAGCGVSTEDEGEARHNGIHRFFLDKGARVVYTEKHIGTGVGKGAKRINPVTDAVLGEDSYLEMDTVQIGGVDTTIRKTTAVIGDRAKLIVKERIMTEGSETAETDFNLTLEGEDSGADLMSRSVARGNSKQVFRSSINGKNRCNGHSSCDAILADNATVTAIPALEADHTDATLIHEAAIGKIAGEQILKLKTLGLSYEEAEEKIISGFLK